MNSLHVVRNWKQSHDKQGYMRFILRDREKSFGPIGLPIAGKYLHSNRMDPDEATSLARKVRNKVKDFDPDALVKLVRSGNKKIVKVEGKQTIEDYLQEPTLCVHLMFLSFH